MGSACSCGKESSEDSPRKDKTNGHVLENGAQNAHTEACGGGAAGQNGVPQNGHIKESACEVKEDTLALKAVENSTANDVSATCKDEDIPDCGSDKVQDRAIHPNEPVDSTSAKSVSTSPAARPYPSTNPPLSTSLDESVSEEELVSIMAGELASLVARLETAVDRLEKAGVPGLAGGGQGAGGTQSAEEECTVPFVLAYDDLLSGPFKTFFDCSMKIGGDVASIAKMVQSTFINQRAFLVMASKSQRPLDSELPQVLEPTGKKIQEVIAFRESKRQSPFFNHLSAISESIPGLSWVAVTPAPAPYVKEMGDSAVFYTNRVLKEYREKDKVHVEWVQNWNNVFKELQEYVKKHHTTGLSWNTRGGNAMANLKAAPANCGVPPPPPAGNIPPPPPMIKLDPKAVAADDGRSALFDSINKGTNITSGLKKVDRKAPRPQPLRTGARTSQTVTDDMKTHKNPSLREGPKPFVKQSSPPNRASPARDGPTAPPKFALEGKKWFIEYQKDKPDLIVKDAKMDQSVYIFRCQNIVVQVKGKVNSVILDSCKKSSVVFENLVSSAEVVNCQSCQVQVMGIMPTISIEKTDGCQVYLSKESLKTEIVTAKSTEMNVLIPKDDGDFVECPIPEQFKTTIKGLSLTTTCSEQAG
ncbi:adenylyl cyclase-associated protein 1-like isoform X4 [Homarus americanus]|uniref:adenylyl cyclase-associated protein 1-like isoform X4 n=1 Tax=Homarus americanus TaxID=6706 RepID=UPI001C43EF14|nr:adenylyl cyclase-associated protein 1-like isoform X4 [Homarus americanus]